MNFLFIELVNEVPVNDEDDGTYYAWKRCRCRCRQRCWSPWAYINFRFLSFSEGEKGPSGEGALFAGIGIDFVLAEPVKFVPLEA